MADENIPSKRPARDQLALDIVNKCGLTTKNLISLSLDFDVLNLPVITLKYNLPEEIAGNLREVLSSFEFEVKKENHD
jgi:hypothetical protein